jgi:hypothetical protein
MRLLSGDPQVALNWVASEGRRTALVPFGPFNLIAVFADASRKPQTDEPPRVSVPDFVRTHAAVPVCCRGYLQQGSSLKGVKFRRRAGRREGPNAVL